MHARLLSANWLNLANERYRPTRCGLTAESSQVLQDATEVTCPKCLAALANDVEWWLAPQGYTRAAR